jgi:hypothetical protein
VLKVAEVEFPSAPQAPMPIVVLWLLDFITLWVTIVVAELFATDVVQVDGVLRPTVAQPIAQVDTVV